MMKSFKKKKKSEHFLYIEANIYVNSSIHANKLNHPMAQVDLLVDAQLILGKKIMQNSNMV